MTDPHTTSSKSSKTRYLISSDLTGGVLLLVATIIALILANSVFSPDYEALLHTKIGIGDFKLSVAHWTSDGLLTIFFFIAGLELKKEVVEGQLRTFSKAIVPVAAAIGGVIVPALFYIVLTLSQESEIRKGWAAPTATDIAFAVAILAVVGSYLPSPLRTFLLTLAVVDDLIAIIIIAFFYSSGVNFGFLALAMIPLGIFALVLRRNITHWYVLIPLSLATWVCVYESGIHATIAGVLLAFVVPMKQPSTPFFKKITVPELQTTPKKNDLDDRLDHAVKPFSSLIAVPIFALCSAGVNIGGASGFFGSFSKPLTIAIMVALVIGKPIGVLTSTFLITKLTRGELDRSIKTVDLLGVACLTGIGFTVSLLISELSFGEDIHSKEAKIGILVGSLIAAIIGSAILLPRNSYYKKLSKKKLKNE